MRWIVGCSLLMIAVFGFAQLGLSADSSAPAVASVGSSTIDADVFRTKYVDYLLKTGSYDSPTRRASFLNQLVTMRLVVLDALEHGASKQPEYQRERRRVSEKLLIDAYAREVVYPDVQVTSVDLEEIFVRANTQLTARHLYARTLPEAQMLVARLKNGEDFESLAGEVFSDPILAESGGLVGPFTFDEMDPAFEDAAFGLQVGETSSPVRTATGYSIIRLVDRFQKPLLTETEFAQRKDKFERFARDRKQRAALSRHLETLVRSIDIAFVDDTVDRLLAQITGQALGPDGEDLTAWLGEPMLGFTDAGSRYSWTVSDFRERAWLTNDDHRAAVKTRDDLVSFATGLAARQVMLARAAALGLDAHPKFDTVLGVAMEEWSYARALERLRATKPPSIDDEQSYLRSVVLDLREKYPVLIHRDVLSDLPLIVKESS